MEFGVVTIVLLTFAAVLILAGLKLLFKPNWFIQFLRGFAGFGLLLVATGTILSALNLASYSQLQEGEDIANVSFTKQNEQSFQATVVNIQTGAQNAFVIDGDMWQIDARVLRVAFAGSTPFYKLDRISGRYYSLEQERSSPKTVFSLAGESVGFDLWRLFKGSDMGIISADYGSATFLPMADGAVFTVSIGVSGLQAKPVNSEAQHIVNEWQ